MFLFHKRVLFAFATISFFVPSTFSASRCYVCGDQSNLVQDCDKEKKEMACPKVEPPKNASHVPTHNPADNNGDDEIYPNEIVYLPNGAESHFCFKIVDNKTKGMAMGCTPHRSDSKEGCTKRDDAIEECLCHENLCNGDTSKTSTLTASTTILTILAMFAVSVLWL